MGASTTKEIPYASQAWAKGGDAVARRMPAAAQERNSNRLGGKEVRARVKT
jgi:hypothetical protein